MKFSLNEELNQLSINPQLKEREIANQLGRKIERKDIDYLLTIETSMKNRKTAIKRELEDSVSTSGMKIHKDYFTFSEFQSKPQISKKEISDDSIGKLSKKVLEKCNLISPCDPNSKLLIGNGHLLAGFGKSNKELNCEIQELVNKQKKPKK